MFANKRFTCQNMPLFRDNFMGDAGDEHYNPTDTQFIQAFVINDSDVPSKPLISIHITEVPLKDERKYLKDKLSIDPVGIIALLPEDAIKFAKVLNMLVGEIFNDMNYRR